MIIIKVPFAEKDEAKALGARWNGARKSWYIPDGQATAPFERWLVATPPGGAPDSAASARIDSYAGKVVVGKHFVELEHKCNPLIECEQCRPILATSGWIAAHESTKKVLQELGSKV